MKNLFIIVFLFLTLPAFSQLIPTSGPIIISVKKGEDSLKGFQLSSNYYTLKNNIENKSSRVYISDTPTLSDISNAAINLVADFFLVIKNKDTMNMVMLVNQPVRQYFVLGKDSKQSSFPCFIKGDISENRAKEIIKNKYDPKAKIEDGKLYFNDKTFTIIPSAELKDSIINLISRENLSSSK